MPCLSSKQQRHWTSWHWCNIIIVSNTAADVGNFGKVCHLTARCSDITAEGRCDGFVCWHLASKLRKIAFEKAYKSWMTLKVIQGNRNCCYSMGHLSLHISGLYNSVSILHRFGDITTFAAYVTAYMTLGSPQFQSRQLKLRATSTFWFMFKHIVVNTCCIFRGIGDRKVSNRKVTFKVTPGHRCWCNSIDHTDLLLVFHFQLCLYLMPFPVYYQLFSKM